MIDQFDSNFSEALNWVAEMHDGQYRKGTKVPYVAHVYGVALSLISAGIKDRDVIIGALTHDIVEDTEATLENVREKFGDVVAEYVAFMSEDKSQPWEVRKQHAIDHIWAMPIGAKWIKLADKVSSLEMMADEVSRGTMDWAKFNRGFSDQKWYYKNILAQLGCDETIKGSPLYTHAMSLATSIFTDEEETR
ncbi:MAG: HD domain-containing protein [Firmicutes bacterium]|nr:HD domain-containing protein [Bacillota bacterium]